MINQVIIEGFIHDVPEKIVTNSGKYYYSASLVCYRSNTKTKQYDVCTVIFTKEQMALYTKLFGKTKPRLCIVGHIRNFRGQHFNIQTDYFGVYPFAQILTGGAKEVVDEEGEVLDDDPDTPVIDDDVMPF